MKSDETIYVRLLGEGTTVYRPTRATLISGSVFRLDVPADYDPDDEDWEFPPGSTVVIEQQRINGDDVLVAVAVTTNEL